MKSSLVFVAGRETTFVIDGPEVEIIRGNQPVARVPFADLLEFAEKHPLRADNTSVAGDHT